MVITWKAARRRLALCQRDASLWNPIILKGRKRGQVCTDFPLPATHRSDEDIISVFGARAQESVRFLTGRDEPALVDEYMRISGSHGIGLSADQPADCVVDVQGGFHGGVPVPDLVGTEAVETADEGNE